MMKWRSSSLMRYMPFFSCYLNYKEVVGPGLGTAADATLAPNDHIVRSTTNFLNQFMNFCLVCASVNFFVMIEAPANICFPTFAKSRKAEVSRKMR